MGIGCGVLGIAAVGGGWYVYDSTRMASQDVTVRVTAPGVEDEAVTIGSDGSVGDALVRAGVEPHDGRLLSVRDGKVVDPELDPARITVEGIDVGEDFPVADGVRITVVDGTDEREGTEVVREPLPAPELPQVVRHVYRAGRDGLVERTVGEVSGEIVDSEVLREAVAPERVEDKVVAFTFDDGPHPTWTPQILFVLKAEGVQATFCQLGDNVERRPKLTEQVAEEGHKLCNHTMSHPNLVDASAEELDAEIGGADDVYEELGFNLVRYFRAPGGAVDDAVVERAAEEDQIVLGWTVDTRDWERDADAVTIAENVEREIEPGAVILLHDGGGQTRQQTIDSTIFLIRVLRQQGYEFTVPLLPYEGDD